MKKPRVSPGLRFCVKVDLRYSEFFGLLRTAAAS